MWLLRIHSESISLMRGGLRTFRTLQRGQLRSITYYEITISSHWAFGFIDAGLDNGMHIGILSREERGWWRECQFHTYFRKSLLPHHQVFFAEIAQEKGTPEVEKVEKHFKVSCQLCGTHWMTSRRNYLQDTRQLICATNISEPKRRWPESGFSKTASKPTYNGLPTLL
ncbi:hypothetical protein F5051DRAFT_57363 [Lentinula edodes]|nr:hypothetical protein F5051DRAFT_57363 [Lentinula edodes]